MEQDPATDPVSELETHLAAFQREFPEIDPQVEAIVAALFRLHRRMDVAYGRQLTALGISNAEWEVLRTLVVAGRPYRLGPGELARSLGLTAAAVTHRVDRMVTDGLVTRSRDENNRVRVIIELTDAGREMWDLVVREAARFEAGLLQDLGSGERAALADGLRRMLERVEETQPDAAGRTEG
ncbi:MarR family winged helix-turn-helix transcriptional regulator [Yinghuangia seranimata]|uniref:MarR family winged helix-turn-helix transcriptional regulator n=1 Tax=Yinghuangia seranimata TaxID=408067 RepID=UPI00248AEAE0|nr:MarR family transcriptional regulator [Yinghuangia seranimata]MDI2132645.1 MarR family transcriptional regulator [Yinghuangia seranimata]